MTQKEFLTWYRQQAEQMYRRYLDPSFAESRHAQHIQFVRPEELDSASAEHWSRNEDTLSDMTVEQLREWFTVDEYGRVCPIPLQKYRS